MEKNNEVRFRRLLNLFSLFRKGEKVFPNTDTSQRQFVWMGVV